MSQVDTDNQLDFVLNHVSSVTDKNDAFYYKKLYKIFKESYSNKAKTLQELLHSYYIFKKYLLGEAIRLLYENTPNKDINKVQLDRGSFRINVVKSLYSQNQNEYPETLFLSCSEQDFIDILDIESYEAFVLHYCNPSHLITGSNVFLNTFQFDFLHNLNLNFKKLTGFSIGNIKNVDFYNIYDIVFFLYLIGDDPDMNIRNLLNRTRSLDNKLYQHYKELHIILIWEIYMRKKESLGKSTRGRVPEELQLPIINYLKESYKSDFVDKNKYKTDKKLAWKTFTRRKDNAKSRHKDFIYDQVIELFYSNYDSSDSQEKGWYKNYNWLGSKGISTNF